MRIVLDVENTTTKRNGKIHMDPFEPNNFLVQVGTKNVDIDTDKHLLTFDHVEYRDHTGANATLLQGILDKTTLLIMHNAQHDLMWLWASGFKYDGEIYDTMLAEYILQRGQKQSMKLAACAERRQLNFQKDDTLTKYFSEGYNTNEIPLKELTFYLDCDLNVTAELFLAITTEGYAKSESNGMDRVRAITCEVCKTLTRMYMRGFRVDRVALPEQVSQVIFSRKITDKKEWVDLFEYTSSVSEFRDAVAANSKLLRKTKAFSCPTCNGVGSSFKKKKDGSNFKKANKCTDCLVRG